MLFLLEHDEALSSLPQPLPSSALPPPKCRPVSASAPQQTRDENTDAPAGDSQENSDGKRSASCQVIFTDFLVTLCCNLRALGIHLLLRVRGPHHWNTWPLTNSPILGGPLGPQGKFHKGPIGFSGPREPWTWNTEFMLQLAKYQNEKKKAIILFGVWECVE